MKPKFVDKLGIEEEREEIELQKPEIPISTTPENDLLNDYAKIRETLFKIITRSDEALDEAVKSMKTVPNASMIESVAHLLKTVSETSKSLIELHKEIQLIEEKKARIKTLLKALETEDEGKDNSKKISMSLKDIIDAINQGNKKEGK